MGSVDIAPDILKFASAGIEVRISDILEMCRPLPDDVVFIAGSLVEGMGNQYSDLDVYVLTNRRRPAAAFNVSSFHRVLSPDRVKLEEGSCDEVFLIHTLVPETRAKIDIEFTQFDELDRLFAEVSALFEYAVESLSLLSKRMPHRNEMLLHRICTGVPIFNPSEFAKIVASAPRKKFEYLGYRWSASDFSIMLDLVGALRSGDGIRALDIARENLALHMHGLLHLLGSTNTKRKWLTRYLQESPDITQEVHERFRDLFIFQGACANNPNKYINETLDLIDDIEDRCRFLLEKESEFPSGELAVKKLKDLLLASHELPEAYAEFEFEYRAKAYRKSSGPTRRFLDM